MNIWNPLPCSVVSNVIPSVDNFLKFAIPAIRVMQPLYGAALIEISYEFVFLFNFYFFLISIFAYCEQ